MSDLPNEPDWREEARWATSALSRALEENEGLRARCEEMRELLDRAISDADGWKAELFKARAENERLQKHIDNLETVLGAETRASLIYQERLAQVSCKKQKLRERLTVLKDDLDAAVDWILEEKDRADAAKEEASKQRQENAALLEKYERLEEQTDRCIQQRSDWIGKAQRAERWAVQGYRLMVEVEQATLLTPHLDKVRSNWLRDLVRRYREGKL